MHRTIGNWTRKDATSVNLVLFGLINTPLCSKTSSCIFKGLLHLPIRFVVRRGVYFLMHPRSIWPLFWHKFRHIRIHGHFRLKIMNHLLFLPKRSVEVHGGGIRLTEDHLTLYRLVRGLTIYCWIRNNLNIIQTTGFWYLYITFSEKFQLLIAYACRCGTLDNATGSFSVDNYARTRRKQYLGWSIELMGCCKFRKYKGSRNWQYSELPFIWQKKVFSWPSKEDIKLAQETLRDEDNKE